MACSGDDDDAEQLDVSTTSTERTTKTVDRADFICLVCKRRFQQIGKILAPLDDKEVRAWIRGPSVYVTEFPLHFLLQYGPPIEIVRRLNQALSGTADGGCAESVFDSAGRLPLHVACAFGCSVEVVALLHQNAWGNSANLLAAAVPCAARSCQPLHYAICNGDKYSPKPHQRQVIEFLVGVYPDAITHRDKNENNPIDLALQCQLEYEIIQILLHAQSHKEKFLEYAEAGEKDELFLVEDKSHGDTDNHDINETENLKAIDLKESAQSCGGSLQYSTPQTSSHIEETQSQNSEPPIDAQFCACTRDNLPLHVFLPMQPVKYYGRAEESATLAAVTEAIMLDFDLDAKIATRWAARSNSSQQQRDSSSASSRLRAMWVKDVLHSTLEIGDPFESSLQRKARKLVGSGGDSYGALRSAARKTRESSEHTDTTESITSYSSNSHKGRFEVDCANVFGEQPASMCWHTNDTVGICHCSGDYLYFV